MGKEDIRSEWKRDMYHNYLIINGPGEERTSFQEKMLEHNRVEGILSFQIHSIDNHKQFHYEVTGYQAISCISEKVPLKLSQVTMLLNHLLEVLKEAKSYLLDTMDFVLLPEYTFIHLPDYKLGLCFYPGYHVPLQEQLVAFLEFLMGSVDYQDKEAVLFVYSLYMKSKEDNITIQELRSFLEHPKENDRTTTLSDEHKFTQQDDMQKLKEQQSHRQSDRMQTFLKQEPRNSDYNNENRINKYKKAMPNLPQKRQLQNKVTLLFLNVRDKIKRKEKEPKIQRNDDSVKNGTKKNQYPFIKEKLEQEEEILYYPLINYVILGLIATICMGILVYMFHKGFLFQPLKKKIDVLKLISILSIMGIALGYGYLKLFSKERKQSRIVTRTTYEFPEKEDLFPNSVSRKDIWEDNSARINYWQEDKKKQNVLTNPTPPNCELPINSREDSLPSLNLEDSYDEEDCTRLLSTPNKEYDSLIPLEPMKYDAIEMKEYPFYIGTAKNNLGYSLTNAVISRYHAKIDKEENSFIITDLDSTNGTFVNGRKLNANENMEIKQGDTVSFANINFIFMCLNKFNIE